MNDKEESIYHEFRGFGLKRVHRLVQGNAKGKWEPARSFCRLGEHLFAAPEGLEGIPEVFTVETKYAFTLEPRQIEEGEDKNWKPT